MFWNKNNKPGWFGSKLTDCTAPAIYGLGETGKVEDAAKIENYLKSDVIAIVRAAMTAIMRLDSEKYTATITELLTDDRVGIVKTARNLIIKTSLPDCTRVMEIFRTTPYENTKQKCFLEVITVHMPLQTRFK